MEMTLMDRSNYFKGLVLLIGKDDQVTEKEKNYLSEVAKVLDFDPIFCEQTINDSLKNKYLTSEPVTFSNSAVAKAFIKDGIKLAFADSNFHIHEFDYLRSIAGKNHLPENWFLSEIYGFLEINESQLTHYSFEIEKYWQDLIITEQQHRKPFGVKQISKKAG
jgi:hypothetical protein